MIKFNLEPKQWIFFSIFILFILYILFQARFIILGPEIAIDYPKDGLEATTSVMVMRGQAHNAAWLTLNGRQIFTDEKGLWEESVVLSRGLSIMTVVARDRFGREEEEQVRIIFN